MNEQDKVKRILEISEDIIRLSVKDNQGKRKSDHEKAVELLARALYDFSIIYLAPQTAQQEILKGTLAKVKIAYNTIENVKKPNIKIKRIPE